MDVPYPHVLGVHLAVFIIEISQEKHLQQVIGHALEHQPSQMVMLSLEDKFVNDAKADVDLEEDCDECPPIKILSVESHEVILVLVFVLLGLLEPAQSASNRSF